MHNSYCLKRYNYYKQIGSCLQSYAKIQPKHSVASKILKIPSRDLSTRTLSTHNKTDLFISSIIQKRNCTSLSISSSSNHFSDGSENNPEVCPYESLIFIKNEPLKESSDHHESSNSQFSKQNLDKWKKVLNLFGRTLVGTGEMKFLNHKCFKNTHFSKEEILTNIHLATPVFPHMLSGAEFWEVIKHIRKPRQHFINAIILHDILFGKTQTKFMQLDALMCKSVRTLIDDGLLVSQDDVFSRLAQGTSLLECSEAQDLLSSLTPDDTLRKHYDAQLAAYIAQRFCVPHEEVFSVVNSNSTIQPKPIFWYAFLFNTLLQLVGVTPQEVLQTPLLLDSLPETVAALSTDPDLNRLLVAEGSSVAELILQQPLITHIPQPLLKRWADLFLQYNVQLLPIRGNVVNFLKDDRVRTASSVLRFIADHKLDEIMSSSSHIIDLVEHPRKMTKLKEKHASEIKSGAADDNLLSPSQSPADIPSWTADVFNDASNPFPTSNVRSAHVVPVYVPSSPIPLPEVYFDPSALNELLKSIAPNSPNLELMPGTNAVTGLQSFRRKKIFKLMATQGEIFKELKRRLNCTGAQVDLVLQASFQLKTVLLDDVIFILNKLLEHGFTKEQILNGLEVLKYDKYAVCAHLDKLSEIYLNYEQDFKPQSHAVNILVVAIQRSMQKYAGKRIIET